MAWRIELLGEGVEAELRALPKDMQARFARIVQLIQDKGLHQVHAPYIKHLPGKLWEMRLTGRDGMPRALYVTAIGQRVVIVRVFVKKSQKTPGREIALALKRAEEVR